MIIDNKYDIDQYVYICSSCIEFKEGDFVNVPKPIDQAVQITGIKINVNKYGISIIYCFDNNIQFPEYEVFETLEDAKNWCAKLK